MFKELISTGRPYLWAFYYALFILFILNFISGFRFVPVGIIFLICLLLKSYAGNKVVTDFFYWHKYKNKLPRYKKQIMLNSAITGGLLLMDILLLVHLPDVFSRTYTFPAFVLFLLVSTHGFLSRWKNICKNVYAPESTSTEIQSRHNR